jgi:hypothetical protein
MHGTWMKNSLTRWGSTNFRVLDAFIHIESGSLEWGTLGASGPSLSGVSAREVRGATDPDETDRAEEVLCGLVRCYARYCAVWGPS